MDWFLELIKTWTTFDSFVVFWLSSAGLAIFVSRFLEQRAWFQTGAADGKFRLVLSLYVLAALLLALWTNQLVPGATDVNMLFHIIIGGVSAFMTGEWYHNKYNKKPASEAAAQGQGG